MNYISTRFLLEITYIFPIILVIHGQDCERRLVRAIESIKHFTGYTDSVYELVPHIPDVNNEGHLRQFCTEYPNVEKSLNELLQDCPGSGDAKKFLAKFAGYEYICNAGAADFGKYTKCIFDLRQKLERDCPTKQDSLSSIRHEALFGGPDDKNSLCTQLHKYVACSNNKVSAACGGSAAGLWYKRFVEAIFADVSSSAKLDCSFGKSVPMWAVGVGAGVALLILWCVGRWLYAQGHCARLCQKVCGDHCVMKRDREKGHRDGADSEASYRPGIEVDNIEEAVPLSDVKIEDDIVQSSGGLIGSNITDIAIFVAIGVLGLLILFCICWCCRAGVCSCCKDDECEDEPTRYRIADSNDNEKDPSSVNSVV